ncbi:hypothetical protein HOD29_05850 [archaeon]|jgi:hypothetical protein|nr:hypothetical protein [archaeon]
MNPNTKIPLGQLKESHLEKISEAYKEVGLEICGTTITEHILSSQVNEWNKKIREFEITPQPFRRADNKLLIGVKINDCDKQLYVHTKITPNEHNIKNPQELMEQYDQIIRDYNLE